MNADITNNCLKKLLPVLEELDATYGPCPELLLTLITCSMELNEDLNLDLHFLMEKMQAERENFHE